MLDLFTIFTKGGIVLWCFRGTQEFFAPPVNALIRSVILQVKKKLENKSLCSCGQLDGVVDFFTNGNPYQQSRIVFIKFA